MNRRLPSTLLFVFLLAGASAGAARAQADLTPDPNNPILTGTPGQWDELAVRLPDVVESGGTIYLFYSGRKTNTSGQSIGLATSTNGTNFTKDPANPILPPSTPPAWDSFSVAAPVVLLDGSGTWHIYYAGRNTAGNGPPPDIGRAISTNGASGPYAKDANPVLSAGAAGDWDGAYCNPAGLLEVSAGVLWMYYSGGAVWPPTQAQPGAIGLAVSTDNGVSWSKYDDPRTTSVPFANSDPVLGPSAQGNWDDLAVAFSDVLRDGPRWLMYYRGWSDNNGPFDYGLACSVDGVSWVRNPGNPILQQAQQPWWSDLTLLGIGGLRTPLGFSAYYGGLTSNNVWSIGVATGPETEELYLDAAPNDPGAGDTLVLSLFEGVPNGIGLLFVTEVSGSPFLQYLPPPRALDPSGVWSMSTVTPPGLSGISVTLQAFALGRLSGNALVTNRETIQF